MYMTMQQPSSYPFHMRTPRPPLPFPWPPMPYRLPHPLQQQYPPSYAQPRNFPLSLAPSSSSCSNTRYHQLKQSTSHPSRRSMRRSLDPTARSYHYPSNTDITRIHRTRPSKTRSTTDLASIPPLTSTHLRKAQSWHRMVNHRQSNLSVSYAKDVQLTPKRHRKHSPSKKRPNVPQRPLSLSPKRRPSFNNRRQQPIQVPECGIVRISTLDEMPINPSSVSNDRSSTKGSVSNSSKRPVISNERSIRRNSTKHRKTRNHTNEEEDRDSDVESTASSSSYSSLQQRLNSSLRHDPLITAAMKDFREHRRASSQNTVLTRALSRDSLCSDSVFRSPSPSLSSVSHDHSQSNFTPAERSEIRQLIQTIQTKDTKPSNPVVPSSPIPSPVEEFVVRDSPPIVPSMKSRKSSLTEELDREFNKLRSRDPDQELTNVIPSSICKRKRIMEKPPPSLPPIPTFTELLRQVQLRPLETSTKTPKEKPIEDIYENPLTSISVPVPRSSPIPSIKSMMNKPDETDKHDYAVPIKKAEKIKPEYAAPKKPLPPISYFQPSRNSTQLRLKTNGTLERKSIRSLSMFNWFHSDVTNPMPTTFQPHRILNHPNEYGTPSVEENIYTSDVKVHVPLPTSAELEDNSLQIHLDNQTILTDHSYAEYQTKSNTNVSSILNDFSHLFKHKHKHATKSQNKSQRCSIM